MNLLLMEILAVYTEIHMKKNKYAVWQNGEFFVC
jgi:hypothetical protein